jgi:hypothetical protein
MPEMRTKAYIGFTMGIAPPILCGIAASRSGNHVDYSIALRFNEYRQVLVDTGDFYEFSQ